MVDIFRDELPLRKRLERIYRGRARHLSVRRGRPARLLHGDDRDSEAVYDPDIRAMVLEGFTEIDKAFAACSACAREQGELPASADPEVLAQLASATIHTIAIRARAQVPRKELEAIVKGAIEVMVRG